MCLKSLERYEMFRRMGWGKLVSDAPRPACEEC